MTGNEISQKNADEQSGPYIVDDRLPFPLRQFVSLTVSVCFGVLSCCLDCAGTKSVKAKMIVRIVCFISFCDYISAG